MVKEKLERTKIKVCYDCKNFHNLEPTGPRKDIWYNHLCKASPFPLEVNPVTGKICAVSKNDLGTKVYYEKIMFDYCRNINQGDCDKYQERSR